jgi:hypothetical protein
MTIGIEKKMRLSSRHLIQWSATGVSDSGLIVLCCAESAHDRVGFAADRADDIRR